VFQILLSVYDEPRHGYSIIQDVRQRTKDEMQLTASTLYDAIARLSDQGLIEEVPEPPPAPAESADRTDTAPRRRDKRRRYYALTPLGRDVVADETRRLERALAMAKAIGVRTVSG
jgi:DNA-binding PadR family transcriptional regulator